MLQNDILLQQHKKHQTLKVQVKLTMGYNLQVAIYNALSNLF